jgi:hypothetical protein
MMKMQLLDFYPDRPPVVGFKESTEPEKHAMLLREAKL